MRRCHETGGGASSTPTPPCRKTGNLATSPPSLVKSPNWTVFSCNEIFKYYFMIIYVKPKRIRPHPSSTMKNSVQNSFLYGFCESPIWQTHWISLGHIAQSTENHTTVYVPSSELGLSHPLFRQRVCPSPPPNQKGGDSRQGVRDWGSPNSDDWRKSLPLCLFCGT